MTKTIILSKLFPEDFCMFDIIVVYIDLNTSSMSLSLTIFLLLSAYKKCHNLFYLKFLFFLNTQTNIVTNLKPFN